LERMPSPETAEVDKKGVDHGRHLFAASGCATCHAGTAGTDRTSHVVTPVKWESFDTPSLRFVGLTAPYFHDGRYTTLDALLADPDSRMGSIATMPASDRQDLVRFLESL
jgi:cytochrome c peroxidase